MCSVKCMNRNQGFIRRRRNTEIIREAKSVPCMRCGETYPFYVMDFHHRDPETKALPIGSSRMAGEQTLRNEIAKCDVLCANCHREVEYVGSPNL